MKNLSLFTLSLFFTLNLYSQTFHIKGLAKSENNEAVPFATVAVFKAKDSTLVKADIADANGGFKISNIPVGKLYITINSIGFQKFNSTAFEIVSTAAVNCSGVGGSKSGTGT